MTTYNGPERRRLLNLRHAIDSASPIQSLAMKRMARMLGPDRLKKLNVELGERKRDTSGFRSLKTPRAIATTSKFFKMAAHELPQHIKSMSLISFSLSDNTLEGLDEAGINTVADFVMKRESELMAVYGLKKDAIRETRDKLFADYGIRTVDNPPEPE